LGPQLEAFLEKYPFVGAQTITKHSLTTVPTVKEILQRELEMRKFSGPWVPHSLRAPPRVARVEASTEMLRIL
jgi:hypothetical protein